MLSGGKGEGQRCIMSPWLLGLKLRDEKGGGWEIKQVLYADDTVLVATAYCE